MRLVVWGEQEKIERIEERREDAVGQAQQQHDQMVQAEKQLRQAARRLARALWLAELRGIIPICKRELFVPFATCFCWPPSGRNPQRGYEGGGGRTE